MPDSDKNFAGSIPEFYDTYMVPLIFEEYAADIARRVASGSPAAVLETAAGSGVVPRALAPLLGSGTRYVVTDLNQPMLDRARSMQGADSRISWRQADALELPFGDEAFDAVCCQFGVMFFPDRVRGYSEARRVLKPGGHFIFNSWDAIEHNDFARIVTETAGAVFLEDPPLFLARTPHGYHDPEVIRADLEQAGFRDIEIETLDGESRAASANHPAFAYCHGTPLRNEIDARDASLLDLVTKRSEQAIAARHGYGPVSGRIRGLVATCRA